MFQPEKVNYTNPNLFASDLWQVAKAVVEGNYKLMQYKKLSASSSLHKKGKCSVLTFLTQL